MALDLQTTQLLAVVAIFALFGAGELVMGKFFAAEATREDDRLTSQRV